MVDNYYIQAYIKCCWIIISDNITTASESETANFEKFNKRYGTYLTELIQSLKLSQTNLIISLYYLHKYKSLNTVNKIDLVEDNSILNYLVLISLILSNKTFNDQSYTLKTWYNISKEQLNFESISLKLLNSLEMHFLSTVNYCLNFNDIDRDMKFWSHLMFNCQNLQVNASIIKYFKNYVTKDDSSSLTPSSTMESLSCSSSTSLDDSIITPSICTPKTPSSIISTPGYKKLPSKKRMGKITKPKKMKTKPVLNHYPSPMKTISIPNSPAHRHHHSVSLPTSHTKFMITPQISYSNSPNYSLYYNDFSPICQRHNTYRTIPVQQVVPIMRCPMVTPQPYYLRQMMYAPQPQHEHFYWILMILHSSLHSRQT